MVYATFLSSFWLLESVVFLSLLCATFGYIILSLFSVLREYIFILTSTYEWKEIKKIKILHHPLTTHRRNQTQRFNLYSHHWILLYPSSIFKLPLPPSNSVRPNHHPHVNVKKPSQSNKSLTRTHASTVGLIVQPPPPPNTNTWRKRGETSKK